ncbi:TPA: hypothetical protein NKB39_001783 [Vibrio parahaemolyticus]|nr:hypothetical protein [Vibrio parahaemolyticus]
MNTESPKNRYQLMQALGATQRNIYWSWCAEDKDNKRLFFTAWEHENIAPKGEDPIFIIQQPWWGEKESGSLSASRSDHNKKLAKYFKGINSTDKCGQFTAYCYVSKAKTLKNSTKVSLPVELEYINTNYIYQIDLIKVRMHPFEVDNAFQEYTIIGLTKGRKLKLKDFDKFKNNSDYIIPPTSL